MATTVQRLRQALDAHRRSFQELDGALLEFENSLSGEASERPDSRIPQLLSIDEVRQTLGMGKSWTYRRIKSGEIPSVKLGRSIKVRQEDLEEYLESRRYQPLEEEA